MPTAAERRAELIRQANEGQSGAQRRLDDLRRRASTFQRARDAAVTAAQGFNRGLATVAGLPGDVTAAGLRAAGQDVEGPVGSQALIGELAEQGGTFQNVQDLPPDLRPFGVAGDVVGQALPFAMAPFGAVQAGARGGMLSRPILDRLRANPNAFATEELAGIGLSAGGAGLAEDLFPGNAAARGAAEIAAPFAPSVLAGRSIAALSGPIRRLRANFGEEGRKQAAAKELQAQLAETGESPEALARQLERGGLVPGETPAQITGSPGLAGIERGLAADPGLDNRLQRRLRETIGQIEQLYDQAVRSGDESLIREAAQLRSQWFDDMLAIRQARAFERRDQAAAALTPGSVSDFGDYSRNVRARLEKSLSDARAVERRLWGQIDQDATLDATNALAARDQAIQDFGLTPEEFRDDATISRFLRRLEPETQELPGGEVLVPQPIRSGEMLRIRSELLRDIRDMRNGRDPNFRMIRVKQAIANGILDDLSELPGVDAARDFSRVLNDRYSRGTVGELLRFNANNDAAVPPELTLERAFRGSGTAGARASRQIEEAAQARGLPGVRQPGEQRTTMTDQEGFLRELQRTAVGADDKINTSRIDRFLKTNSELLRRFPNLRDDLANASSAQKLVQNTAKFEKRARQALRENQTLRTLLNTEDPRQAVLAVLRGGRPAEGMGNLIRLTRRENARRGNTLATDGLKTATLSTLLEATRRPVRGVEGGMPSGMALIRILDGSAAGQPSLRKQMLDSGILTRGESKRLNKVIEAMIRVENAATSTTRMTADLPEASFLEDAITRAIGVNIAARSPLSVEGPSQILVAGRGSEAARRAMQEVPIGKVKDMLIRAIEDPDLMAELLTKNRQPSGRPVTSQMNAFLFGAAVPEEQQREEMPDLPRFSPFPTQVNANQ